MQMTLDPATERLFADLYRLHEARALRTAFALLGDRAAAEDAVQEAFVQAFRTLPRKREDVTFSTWLYRCLVWAARAQRRMRRARELLLADPPGEADAVENVTSSRFRGSVRNAWTNASCTASSAAARSPSSANAVRSARASWRR